MAQPSVISNLFDSGLLWQAEAPSTSQQHLTAPFGIEALDIPLGGGLPFGAIHECSFEANKISAPRSLFCILLAQALKHHYHTHPFQKYLLWIGREVWPSPFLLRQTLCAERDLFSQCLFLDPRSPQELLWVLDIVLRSHAVWGVVTTSPPLSLSISKRFSLLVENCERIAFFLSDTKKVLPHRAFASRWSLSPVVPQSLATETHGEASLFRLKLLTRKGSIFFSSHHTQHNSWILEVPHERQGASSLSLRLFSELVDSALSKEAQTGGGSVLSRHTILSRAQRGRKADRQAIHA